MFPLPPAGFSVAVLGGGVTPPPVVTYIYLRPGGVDTFLRPGGVDTYIRP